MLSADVVQAFLKRATQEHGVGRFAQAIALYEHVEAHNPDALAATYFRALIDLEQGKLDAALMRLQRVAKADPSAFEALYGAAYTLGELERWPEAVAAYRRAIVVKPQSTSAQFNLGAALEIVGDIDGAIAVFTELTEHPLSGVRIRALAWLARLRPSAFTQVQQAVLVGALEAPETPEGLKISLSFTLGMLFEHQGGDDAAFGAFRSGNDKRRANLLEDIEGPVAPVIAPPSAIIRAQRPEVIAQQHVNMMARHQGLFTKQFLAEHADMGSDSFAPIFIVGMPRSGSSLIEQILSSHPMVSGMGEVPNLFQITQGQYPLGPSLNDGREHLASDHFRKLAHAYLKSMHGRGWGSQPRVIDKMLGNYSHIGMIHLMFPKAVILNSLRDPVETCLGCYRILFRTGNELTYDLADLGALYVRYRQMMDHWAVVLPGRVITVQHEALVDDPDGQIRWLVTQACGLKWTDACLRFHENKRSVRTASVGQVRQPIFRTSIQRWRRYERHLGPLFEALGPYAPDRGAS